jgi:hypothetical protein
MPIGSPCSFYQNYTLRIEKKAKGQWFAHTNWREDEIDEAREIAAKIIAKALPDCEEVRLIRIRFEVLLNSDSIKEKP